MERIGLSYLSQEGWEALLSHEGYKVLVLCYCHGRDGCYYCAIVTGGIGGAIIVSLSQEG